MIPNSRICRTCKVEKLLTDFNRGNAAFGRKSECRECQHARSRVYKRLEHVKKRESKNSRLRRSTWSDERRTEYYLRKKDYYIEWKKNNPEKYRWSEKSKQHRRRLRLEKGIEKLTVLKVKILEQFNKHLFSATNFTCEYCESLLLDGYDLDHIIPVKLKGTNSIYNLAISCFQCNSKKKAKLLKDWKPELVEKFSNRVTKLFYFIENYNDGFKQEEGANSTIIGQANKS